MNKKQVSFICLCAGSIIAITSQLISCGGNVTMNQAHNTIPPNGPNEVDNSVVHGIAVVDVMINQEQSILKFFDNLLMPKSYATSTATSNVTYNNSPSVTFTVNTTALVGSSFTGNTLSLGSFSITALKDNNLKVCNPGGNTKCTTAILRVYTTGSVAGFVNTSDTPQYGSPVYVTGDNPTTALVLNSPGTEIEQVLGMASSKHTVLLSDFATTTFNVTSDFTNSGTGSYVMTFVIEYALAP